MRFLECYKQNGRLISADPKLIGPACPLCLTFREVPNQIWCPVCAKRGETISTLSSVGNWVENYWRLIRYTIECEYQVITALRQLRG